MLFQVVENYLLGSGQCLWGRGVCVKGEEKPCRCMGSFVVAKCRGGFVAKYRGNFVAKCRGGFVVKCRVFFAGEFNTDRTMTKLSVNINIVLARGG